MSQDLFEGLEPEQPIRSSVASEAASRAALLLNKLAPLAERMRPKTIDEVIGQKKLLGPGQPLRVAFETHRPHSMILWGPQIPEAHPPPGRQRKETGQRDKAKAAHLDEEEQHCLPEKRELRPGVPHDEAGDAGGAGGREQGVHQPQPPLFAGNGQAEQQRARRDHQQKADTDGLGGTAAGQPAFLFAEIEFLLFSF